MKYEPYRLSSAIRFCMPTGCTNPAFFLMSVSGPNTIYGVENDGGIEENGFGSALCKYSHGRRLYLGICSYINQEYPLS